MAASCLDVDDPDLENDVCKTESTDYAAMEQIPIPCGARVTLFSIQVELDADRPSAADFAWECWVVFAIARENGR
jgi:hypothetical protein